MGRGLGLSRPKPSLSPNPRPGLLFYEAWAPVSQAKAPAFRPSQSCNITTGVLDKLVTIANVGENHWIALLVDFRCSKILYGNSIRGTIDDDIEEALT